MGGVTGRVNWSILQASVLKGSMLKGSMLTPPMFQDIAAGDRDREVVPEERVQAEGDRRADGEVPGPGGQDGAGEQLQHLQLLLRPLQVKSFEGEKRKLEQKIEKLTKQISVLEKAVEDNRDVAQTKEKAINETKQSMIQVTEEIGIY